MEPSQDSEVPEVLDIAQELEQGTSKYDKYLAGLLRSEYLRAEKALDNLDAERALTETLYLVRGYCDYGALGLYLYQSDALAAAKSINDKFRASALQGQKEMGLTEREVDDYCGVFPIKLQRSFDVDLLWNRAYNA